MRAFLALLSLSCAPSNDATANTATIAFRKCGVAHALVRAASKLLSMLAFDLISLRKPALSMNHFLFQMLFNDAGCHFHRILRRKQLLSHYSQFTPHRVSRSFVIQQPESIFS